jgi:hypothetical protein
MSPASHVRLDVELTDNEAYELAQFIKRVRFDQVRELTESGQSREQRDDQAYRMLYALDQVGGALRNVGYAPR